MSVRVNVKQGISEVCVRENTLAFVGGGGGEGGLLEEEIGASVI